MTARREMGWTQTQSGMAYAEYMDMPDSHRQTISYWEAGKHIFNIEQVLVFSRVYAKPIEWWFEGLDVPELSPFAALGLVEVH